MPPVGFLRVPCIPSTLAMLPCSLMEGKRGELGGGTLVSHLCSGLQGQGTGEETQGTPEEGQGCGVSEGWSSDLWPMLGRNSALHWLP